MSISIRKKYRPFRPLTPYERIKLDYIQYLKQNATVIEQDVRKFTEEYIVKIESRELTLRLVACKKCVGIGRGVINYCKIQYAPCDGIDRDLWYMSVLKKDLVALGMDLHGKGLHKITEPSK